jgi:hypothetical protein
MRYFTDKPRIYDVRERQSAIWVQRITFFTFLGYLVEITYRRSLTTKSGFL